MNKIIYLVAMFVAIFTFSLYIPKFQAYAQEKKEQRELNKQILDLELELSDTQSQRLALDDGKQELLKLIDQYVIDVANIEQAQENLHTRAEEIRKELDILKWDASLNDKLVNCYQWTGDLYNDCLDAVIQVGLNQRRQPQ